MMAADFKLGDYQVFTKSKRSGVMWQIRGRGNRDTESLLRKMRRGCSGV